MVPTMWSHWFTLTVQKPLDASKKGLRHQCADIGQLHALNDRPVPAAVRATA